MKNLLYVCCILLLGTMGFSQHLKPIDLVKNSKTNFVPTQLFNKVPRNAHKVPSEIQEYQLINIESAALDRVLKSDNPSIMIDLPISERTSLRLQLVEVQLPAFLVRSAPDMKVVKYQNGKHYRGIVAGDNQSIVAVSIFDNEVMGVISSTTTHGNLVLGKLEGAQSHIVYEDHQLADRFDLGCETADVPQQYTQAELYSNNGVRALTDCVGLYFEIDYDIYVNKGSSTTNATNYVTGLYNQVATLYANEQINTNISEIVVWTQTSPYSGSTSGALLNAFTAYRQGFNGDLAMLLSYQASGGIAYVNGLCNSNPDYRMSFSSIDATYQNVPTYSWSVMVVTHEFGHLLGSQHTHACVWNGNNTAIDGCYTTEGNCPNPGIPSNGGTVMSYCHLTSAGINLNNGFGPQPGNVIRSRVTNANCLNPCGPPPPPPGPCTENVATLTILTDNYPGETTWQIRSSNGTVLYSGGPYSTANTTYTTEICEPNGCYDFVIFDSYGDGICCGFGQGNYAITAGGNTLISGGAFGSSETQNFCLGGTSGPTCNDGVQNGQETGVDCGGPTCPACPTCNDGIQNGNETDVDCGGPDCPACPTCNDGIQNGDETGVDCGGSCSPCGGGGTDLLGGHYFESGWDGWIDGGSDVFRYSGAYSYEGSYSIRIRDNSGAASTMTSPTYNMTPYNNVTLQFYFYAWSMESGESFFVQYFDGSSWSTIANYVSGTSFQNNTFYVATINLNSASTNFATNSRFRITCNASTNSDHVYIDAVTVEGSTGSNLPESSEPQLVKDGSRFDGISDEIVTLFPNPTKGQLHLTIIDEEEAVTDIQSLEIFDMMGRKMMSYQDLSTDSDQIVLDVSTLNSGAYILRLNTNGDEFITKRFQVIKE